jgi:NTE family protein
MLRRSALLCFAIPLVLSLVACSTPPVTPAVTSATAKMQRMPKLGLALGGGGTKGFAHVGVIKVLESQGFTIDFVSGTSAGSVVGALYASGMDGYTLQQTSFALDESQLRDISLFSGGLVKGEKLQSYINELVKNRPLEKLGKPFVAVATDLDTGARIAFARGDTGQAVRASSSIPGVFQPVTISGKRYVDGGVVSPVPVDAAREMGAEFVIAVDISAKAQVGGAGNWAPGIMSQAVTIMGQKLGEQELGRAEVVIRPAVAVMGVAAFDQKHNAILEGEKAAQAALPALREAIAKWQASRP